MKALNNGQISSAFCCNQSCQNVHIYIYMKNIYIYIFNSRYYPSGKLPNLLGHGI
jgi:hypothetical protein